jgi:membrane-bound inhibitor of C-type lysozyme
MDHRYGKIGLLALAGLFVLGACGRSEETETGATASGAAAGTEAAQLPEGHPDIGAMEMPAAVTRIGFECADQATFELAMFEGTERARLTIGEEVHELERQEVASGMSYSDGSLTLHGKGMDAYVEKDGERILSDCKAAGHPAPAGGE